MKLDFIADLRSLTSVPPVTADRIFFVTCHSTINDEGGGTFMWIPVSLATPLKNDDNGIVIRTANNLNPLWNAGYFLRQFSGPINVRWFGAKGDGTTDDTAAVHAARDSDFAINGSLYFPVGTYVGAFEFPQQTATKVLNEINLIGDGQGTVLKSNGTSSGGYPNPVLRLGYRVPHWRKAKVFNLVLDGSTPSTTRFSDGVIYDDPTSPELSGRWEFEKVTFTNCKG